MTVLKRVIVNLAIAVVIAGAAVPALLVLGLQLVSEAVLP